MDLIKNKIKQIDPRIPSKKANLLMQLIEFGAIHSRDFKCSKCDSQLIIWLRQRDSKSKPHISWRCSNGKCHRWISFIENSFFANFKKPLETLIKIIKYWCIQISIAKTVETLKLDSDIDVNRKTV